MGNRCMRPGTAVAFQMSFGFLASVPTPTANFSSLSAPELPTLEIITASWCSLGLKRLLRAKGLHGPPALWLLCSEVAVPASSPGLPAALFRLLALLQNSLVEPFTHQWILHDLCMYVHVFVRVQTYMYTCIYIYMYIDISVYTHVHLYYMYVYFYIYIGRNHMSSLPQITPR